MLNVTAIHICICIHKCYLLTYFVTLQYLKKLSRLTYFLPFTSISWFCPPFFIPIFLNSYIIYLITLSKIFLFPFLPSGFPLKCLLFGILKTSQPSQLPRFTDRNQIQSPIINLPSSLFVGHRCGRGVISLPLIQGAQFSSPIRSVTRQKFFSGVFPQLQE